MSLWRRETVQYVEARPARCGEEQRAIDRVETFNAARSQVLRARRVKEDADSVLALSEERFKEARLSLRRECES